MNYLIGLSANKIISGYTADFCFDNTVTECVIVYIMPIVYHLGTMGTNAELISWISVVLNDPPNPDLTIFIRESTDVQENKKIIIEHIIRYIINAAMMIATFNKRAFVYYTDIILANSMNTNLARISNARKNIIQPESF